MASNYTTNYQLNQWEAGDQVLRTEFNQDNQKIDTALAGLAGQNEELETALATAVAGAGNCRMELFTYTGTGTCGVGNPTRVQFSHLPEVFFIGGGRALMMGRGGVNKMMLLARDSISSNTFFNDEEHSWSGNQLSMVNTVDARYQMKVPTSPTGCWDCSEQTNNKNKSPRTENPPGGSLCPSRLKFRMNGWL